MRKPRFLAFIVVLAGVLGLFSATKPGPQQRARARSVRVPGDIERPVDHRASDLYWVRTYGTSTGDNYDEDYGNTILPTPDGGYICAGQTWNWQDSTGSYAIDTLVLKLDSVGDLEWKKIYKGTIRGYSSSSGRRKLWRVVEASAALTRDGGYLIASETARPAALGGNRDIWILKLFPNGEVEWQKSYDAFGYESVRGNIQPTEDGGYILAGETTSMGDRHIWVLKLNSIGGVEWQRAYGNFERGFNDVYATSIYPTSEGGYILGGNVLFGNFTTGASKLNFSSWVAKLTDKGDIEWQKLFTDVAKFVEGGPIVRPTRDGGFAYADFTDTAGTGLPDSKQSDFLIMKLSRDGMIQWQRLIGTPNFSECPPHSIQETGDGGFVITGFTHSGGLFEMNSAHRADILKLDQNGQLIWQRQLGPAVWSYLFGIQVLAGGDLLMTGGLSPTAFINYSDIFAVKLNATGTGLPCGLIQNSDLILRDSFFIPQTTSIVPKSIPFATRDTMVVPEDVPMNTELLCWNLNQPPQNVACTQEINRSLFRKESFNRIRWKPNPLNSPFTITEYRVYRTAGVFPPSFSLVASVGSDELDCLDGPMNTEVEYYYSVTSVDSAGRESPKCTPVLAGK